TRTPSPRPGSACSGDWRRSGALSVRFSGPAAQGSGRGGPMRGGRLNQRTALGATTAALLLAGCGSGSHYANNPRPPSPITITAAISGNRVGVSPTRFGAGRITLV